MPTSVLITAGLFLLAAFALAVIRLLRGPDIVDRIAALELIAGTTMAIFVLFAVRFEEPLLLDAAMAIAVISFLGTVALERYLEKGISRKEEPPPPPHL